MKNKAGAIRKCTIKSCEQAGRAVPLPYHGIKKGENICRNSYSIQRHLPPIP